MKLLISLLCSAALFTGCGSSSSGDTSTGGKGGGDAPKEQAAEVDNSAKVIDETQLNQLGCKFDPKWRDEGSVRAWMCADSKDYSDYYAKKLAITNYYFRNFDFFDTDIMVQNLTTRLSLANKQHQSIVNVMNWKRPDDPSLSATQLEFYDDLLTFAAQRKATVIINWPSMQAIVVKMAPFEEADVKTLRDLERKLQGDNLALSIIHMVLD